MQHRMVIINRQTKKVIYIGLCYYLANFSKMSSPAYSI